MKLITTASYYGTGSSAITDLLSEYETIHSMGSEFECRIAHDYHGISDLEYYLVENPHRHNSSIAIRDFQRLIDLYGRKRSIRLENYENAFGPDFYRCIDQYIDQIAPGHFQGGCHLDLYRMGDDALSWIKVKNRLFQKFSRHGLFTPTADDDSFIEHRVSPLERIQKSQTTYITYPREIFLDATKTLFDNLFSPFDDGKTEGLLVDQLVPPSNTMRYIRYFRDLQVICVDRDPRDLFYLETRRWKSRVIPDQVDEFISWFQATRAHLKYEQDDPQRVMRIHFEDLVLHYDACVNRIERFLNLDPSTHTRCFESFDPQISRKNIGKWKNDPSILADIQLIERKLPEFIQYTPFE